MHKLFLNHSALNVESWSHDPKFHTLFVRILMQTEQWPWICKWVGLEISCTPPWWIVFSTPSITTCDSTAAAHFRTRIFSLKIFLRKHRVLDRHYWELPVFPCTSAKCTAERHRHREYFFPSDMAGMLYSTARYLQKNKHVQKRIPPKQQAMQLGVRKVPLTFETYLGQRPGRRP